jgi:hypothetical protein
MPVLRARRTEKSGEHPETTHWAEHRFCTHSLHAGLACDPVIIVGCVPAGHDGPVNGKP